jgi:tRNA pseudouridine55 synthase
VEAKPRIVEIDEIILLDWAPAGPAQRSPLLTVEVACSPGTYIRSLAHDLGRALGSGAYLSTLVRLKSGRFGLDDSVSLDRLEEAFREGDETRYLLPVDEALLDWPALIATPEETRRIAQGLPVEGGLSPVPLGVSQERAGRSRRSHCRAYSHDGEFLAILTFRAELGQWWPEKVFAPIAGREDGPILSPAGGGD